jgi:hypothetical protein
VQLSMPSLSPLHESADTSLLACYPYRLLFMLYRLEAKCISPGHLPAHLPGSRSVSEQGNGSYTYGHRGRWQRRGRRLGSKALQLQSQVNVSLIIPKGWELKFVCWYVKLVIHIPL